MKKVKRKWTYSDYDTREQSKVGTQVYTNVDESRENKITTSFSNCVRVFPPTFASKIFSDLGIPISTLHTIYLLPK